MSCAISSLPTPVSPLISTLRSLRTVARSWRISAVIAGESPTTMPSGKRRSASSSP